MLPHECRNLEDIRSGMDAVDLEIVRLIAQRIDYVREAAKHKTTSANVAAPDRVAAVLKTRREWAEAAGLRGDVVENLYSDLVAYCVAEEHIRWKQLNPDA